MIDRNVYQQDMARRLAECRHDCEMLRAEAKADQQAQVAALIALYEIIEQKQQQLEASSDAQWPEARRQVDVAFVTFHRNFADLLETAPHLRAHVNLGWAEGQADHLAAPTEGWAEGQGHREVDSEGWAEGLAHRDPRSEGWPEGQTKK